MEELLDCRGMKCPLPMLKLINLVHSCQQGTLIRMLGDCETFEEDIRRWCGKSTSTLISLVDLDNFKEAKIQI